MPHLTFTRNYAEEDDNQGEIQGQRILRITGRRSVPRRKKCGVGIPALHNSAIVSLAGIEFSMTLKDIPKFECLNAMLINVYNIDRSFLYDDKKKKKRVNMLYVQDPRLGHFGSKICRIS